MRRVGSGPGLQHTNPGLWLNCCVTRHYLKCLNFSSPACKMGMRNGAKCTGLLQALRHTTWRMEPYSLTYGKHTTNKSYKTERMKVSIKDREQAWIITPEPIFLDETYVHSLHWLHNSLQPNATQNYDCNRIPQTFSAMLCPVSCQLHPWDPSSNSLLWLMVNKQPEVISNFSVQSWKTWYHWLKWKCWGKPWGSTCHLQLSSLELDTSWKQWWKTPHPEWPQPSTNPHLGPYPQAEADRCPLWPFFPLVGGNKSLVSDKSLALPFLL